MNYPIVMFVGQLGSGKDTAAGFMRERVKLGVPVTLAAPMKEFAKKVFGFTHEQMYGPSALREQAFTRPDEEVRSAYLKGERSDFLEDLNLTKSRTELDNWMRGILDGVSPRTGRSILQTLGTEFGRAQDPSVWINAGIKGATLELIQGADLVTITDGRFRNEVLAVKKVGGMVVQVINPDSVSTATHPSEKEQESIPAFWYDYRLVNRKGMGLMNLKHLVDSIPL